ncbi:hypothetical protein VPIG_00137 [Vibrio phage PWH3a-P1]|uniref:hypothetical protein n=1 Tax=Vibrio phage PWH3a-P1 TaxID=754058 RepID=UPI0002C0C094|nr:hypothetical protein VPIG_00137 [Vibrio phage PWH3a-P1]AGH31994.1 hypothetical protein VPIG_00137 [Vibrio phage PWH3a-P1]
MKTFEQIVDECFKPNKVVLLYTDERDRDLALRTGTKSVVNLIAKQYIYKKYIYSSKVMSGDFYGKDINEPVIKICKRILDKHERFSLIHDYQYESVNTHNGVLCTESTLQGFSIMDKDTNKKFVVSWGRVKNLSFLTEDENQLLAKVLREWYDFRKGLEHEKKLKREQKRKNKFRQELTDLYKDL